jgi:alpha-mannosidase
MTVSLYADSPAVRCTYRIDNQALDHRLRARIPTGLTRGPALAGSQFSPLERSALDQTGGRYPRETPVTTAPAQRFVARAMKNRGLAVFAPGFFEYEMDRRGDLLVTLLRAVGQLSRSDLAARPGHAGWPTATPLAQCLGPDRIQLACAPVTQGQLGSGSTLPELWEDLFVPLQAVWLRQASPLNFPPVEVRLEGTGLVFSALKPGEQNGALVLRCYNATNGPTAGTWHFGSPVRSAHRARADEQPLHEIRLGEGSSSVPFHAGPYELVTVMVVLHRVG